MCESRLGEIEYFYFSLLVWSPHKCTQDIIERKHRLSKGQVGFGTLLLSSADFLSNTCHCCQLIKAVFIKSFDVRVSHSVVMR